MAKDIIVAFITVASIGLIAGILLAIISHLFKSEEDSRLTAVRACLPGYNCGACGYRGCDDYAAAIAKGEAKANLCIPGGTATTSELAALLGVTVGKAAEMTAFVHCNGTCEATEKKAVYDGVHTCKAAAMIYGGPNTCTYGCLGYGDCADVCPSKTICIEDGIARIDPNGCVGCGLCARTCPKHLISIIPKGTTTAVMCNNSNKGAEARKACTNACIGCKKCEKTCETGAITVTDNLAKIDYEKCNGCGACVENCPTHCLKQLLLGNLT